MKSQQRNHRSKAQLPIPHYGSPRGDAQLCLFPWRRPALAASLAHARPRPFPPRSSFQRAPEVAIGAACPFKAQSSLAVKHGGDGVVKATSAAQKGPGRRRRGAPAPLLRPPRHVGRGLAAPGRPVGLEAAAEEREPGCGGGGEPGSSSRRRRAGLARGLLADQATPGAATARAPARLPLGPRHRRRRRRRQQLSPAPQ